MQSSSAGRVTGRVGVVLALTAASGALVMVAATARPARAASPIDMIEHFFGASNVNAVAGNGGLTIGVAHSGELSVLSWPSPSYYDQLDHLATNALDVRDRPFLAAPQMGASLGIAYATEGGAGFTWLRDDGWTVEQGYADPAAAVIETRFANAALGLHVGVHDFVLPDRDVWVRAVAIEREATSPVTELGVIAYTNFAPTLSRVPQIPLADWALDAHNDFAALYHPDADAIIHFRPRGAGDVLRLGDLTAPPAIDYGAVGEALRGDDFVAIAPQLAAELDTSYGPGVYLALGASVPTTSHQIGFDATPMCAALDELVDNIDDLETVFADVPLPVDPGVIDALRCTLTVESIAGDNAWVYDAQDAYADAADGVLSGSPGAAGRVNAAIGVPLALVDGRGEVAFYVAAAATAGEAFAQLEAARAVEPAAHEEATLADWRAWTARARLPRSDNPRVLDVCRRALINIRVGTDRDSGAIVASVARQPSYAEDWPRDGAFFNAALDIAGYPEMVERHNAFYVRTLRSEDVEPVPIINEPAPIDPDDRSKTSYPKDAWEMNYYADGEVGGPIRFEIDNTGLAVWALASHAQYVDDAGARAAYLEEVWPAIARAADLLARWRHEITGLQARASEDDNVDYTQSLHGAVTVYAGLTSAAAAAHELGHGDAASRYDARAKELHAAILTHLFDPERGLFVGTPTSPATEEPPLGASGWLVWPAGLLPLDDPRVQAQMQATLPLALRALTPVGGGGSYITKVLTAAGLAASDDEQRAEVERGLLAMVELVATPDTDVLGEAFVPVDSDGDGVEDRFSSRVANPHLWAGALVYLTAMSLSDPERFFPAATAAPSDGCGCGSTGSGLGWVAAAGIAGGLVLRRRARARRRVAASP